MSHDMDTQDMQNLSPDAVRDLMNASMDALRSALQTDLRDLTLISPAEGGQWSDQPQDLRRDLHAMDRLYGIHMGPVRAEKQRPGMADVRTLVVPSDAGIRIVVLSKGGDAVVYRPEGRKAALVSKCHAQELIDAIFATDTHKVRQAA